MRLGQAFGGGFEDFERAFDVGVSAFGLEEGWDTGSFDESADVGEANVVATEVEAGVAACAGHHRDGFGAFEVLAA